MPKKEYLKCIPENIEELKRLANNKNDYKSRLKAISELEQYKCRQSIDILWRLMINDKVYGVQHKAFLALQNFEEKVKLPKKKKGHLIKDINKKLLSIYNSFNGDNHSFSQFVERFKSRYPEAYDVYSYEKNTKMQKWIENVINYSFINPIDELNS